MKFGRYRQIPEKADRTDDNHRDRYPENPGLSSLQIQQEDGKIYTLSSKSKEASTFWQRDYLKGGDIISRSLFKRLNEDIWLEMNINCGTGKREITIVKKNIKV